MVWGWQTIWLAALLSVITLGMALVIAPWKLLQSKQERQHAVFAAIVLLALFWQLQLEVRETLLLHPIAMNVVVMVFGSALALIIGAAALVLGHLLGGPSWTLLPFEYLIMVMVPVAVVSGLLTLISRVPKANMFFYLFGAAFFGAVPTLLAVGVVAWLYLQVFAEPHLQQVFTDHSYLLLLMMFPEGFINCSVATVVTVLRPDLVRTFDDHRYLDDKDI